MNTIFLFIFTAALFACSNGHDSDATISDDYVEIAASGQTLQLGTFDTAVLLIEQNPMWVSFSQNFRLSKTETTLEDFKDLMGYLPSGTESDPKDFPVRNVSWYEAIVYCNKASRYFDLDTVYSWSKADTAADGHVLSLVGLAVNWNANGVRLPTEAEWNFAAQELNKSNATTIAWIGSNSSGQPHAVAAKPALANGLYDMGGNLLEWVFDNQGPYVAGDTVADFAGQMGDATGFNRVLKGGSYMHDSSAMLPLHRKDTYERSASDKALYIGFRTAIGSLTPSFASGSQIATITYRSKALLTSFDIHRFLGGPSFKLVFVDRETGRLSILTPSGLSFFPDTGTINHPTLSPDGNWITYGTRAEGQSGDGTVWIRSANPQDSLRDSLMPGHIPRWRVDPATLDTQLVILQSAINNNASNWPSYSTISIGMFGNHAYGRSWTLTQHGSWNGGLSTQGDWLFSGFSQLLRMNIATQGIDTLFTSPDNGKSINGSTQACNVSTSPDSVPRILFLDFGSTETSTVVGSSYGIHEYLFLADANGKILKTFKAPKGFASWDDAEWSQSPSYAVATSRTAEGAATTIQLINLETGNNLPVVQGPELGHPYLWLPKGQISRSFSTDSAGLYAEPGNTQIQRIYCHRLREFWKRPYDKFYVVGNSLTADGVAPEAFSDSGYNMGIGGSDLKTHISIIHDYILPHSKPVWIGINIAMEWYTQPLDYWSWKSDFLGSTGRIYDENQQYWPDTLPTGWREYMSTLPPVDIGMQESSGGTFIFPATGWGDTHVAFDWNTGNSITDPILAANLDSLEALAMEIQSHNIYCLLFTTPVDPDFVNTSYYSTAGLERTVAKQILDRFQALASSQPKILFYDGNKFGLHDYTDAEASDGLHLSYEGALRFSKELRDSLIAWGVPTQ